LVGCSTDFNVNGPAKVTPIVYGYLDPDAAVQTIRVQKGYQNPSADARVLAKDQSVNEFDTNLIVVSLVRLNGSITDTIGRFYPEIAHKKDTVGDFYAPNQLVYRLNTTGAKALQSDYNYKVCIWHKPTNDRSFTATTPLIGEIETNLPSALNPSLYSLNPNLTSKFLIQVFSPCKAAIISMSMIVPITEDLVGGGTRQRTVTIKNVINGTINPVRTDCSAGALGNFTEYQPASSLFYNTLLDSLAATSDQVQSRHFGNLKCVFTGLTQSVLDFQSITQQYVPISQTVPVYTNVKNGIGLVGGARSRTVLAKIPTDMVSRMNKTSADGSSDFPQLKALKFVYP
jgi:hypothetical protein